MFLTLKPSELDVATSHQSNMSKRRTDTAGSSRKRSTTSEDFGDGGLDDDALVNASIHDLEFHHIEDYPDPIGTVTRNNTAKNKSTKSNDAGKSKNTTRPLDAASGDNDQEPVQLANGKWACNHPCKDRLACKHLCCKDGMDKPPKKKAATKRVPPREDPPESTQKALFSKGKGMQTKLQLTSAKRKISTPIEEIDLTQEEKKQKADYGINGPRDYRSLHQLHRTIQGKELPRSLHSVMYKKPAYCYSQGGEHSLEFMDPPTSERPPTSSDYGDFQFDELSAYFDKPQQSSAQHESLGAIQEPKDYMDHEASICHGSDTFGDDNSLVEDAMIGLADSQDLQGLRESEFDVPGEDDNLLIVALPDCKDGELSTLTDAPNPDHEQPPEQEDLVGILDMLDDEPAKNPPVEENPVPEAFKDLEPWIFQEFGDVVELVDE
jgi:ATP-dependent DNA helicase HFM1/MER3